MCTDSESPTNTPAMGRRSSCSMALWGTDQRPGGPSWRGSPTISPWWPGMHPGPGDRPILRKTSPCPATPIVWPASSMRWIWRHRQSWGCRSAARSLSSSTGGTPRPDELVLVSAYAGWGGSLPSDVVEQRLQQALVLADLSAGEFAAALLPTMFSDATPAESVDRFGAALREFHPAGFRAMARASAEDLRAALPLVTQPTLLVCGDQDVRAPLTVAEDLHSRSPAPPSSCSRAPATSATSKRPSRSTLRSATSSAAPLAADEPTFGDGDETPMRLRSALTAVVVLRSRRRSRSPLAATMRGTGGTRGCQRRVPTPTSTTSCASPVRTRRSSRRMATRREQFETIVSKLDDPDLGLGDDHDVELVWDQNDAGS